MKPTDFQENIRGETDLAIKTLKRLMRCRDKRTALAAAKEVLNRGYGKSPLTSYDPWIEQYKAVDINTLLNDDESESDVDANKT